MKSTLTPLLVYAVLFTASTSLLSGYDMCIVSSVLTSIEKEFNLCEKSSDDGAQFNCIRKALFVSIVSPGAAVGSLAAGAASDFAGRRRTLIGGSILIISGSICFILAHQYAVILIGRFIIGLGVGVGFVISSTYTSEVSPQDRRGQLIAFQECIFSAGCLLSFAIVALISPHRRWNLLLSMPGVIAFIQVIGIYWLPESPRWLVRHGRSDLAVVALKRLMGQRQSDTAESHHQQTTRDSHADSNNQSEFQNGDSHDGDSTGDANDESQSNEYSSNSHLQRDQPKYSLPVDKSVNQSVDQASTEAPRSREVENGVIESLEVLDDRQLTAEELVERINEEYLRERARQRVYHRRRRRSKEQSKKDQPGEDQTIEQKGLDGEQPIPSDVEETTSTISPSSDYDSLKFWDKIMAQSSLCWEFRHRVLIAIGCAVAQNLTVSNSVLYFAFDVLKVANIEDPTVAGLLIGGVKFLGIVLAICLVERIGRRTLLLIGSISTCVCHILLSLLFFLNRDVNEFGIIGILILLVLLIHIFSWNISWAGLMFVVAAEVLPSSIRGLGMGLTVMTFWGLAFFFQSTIELTMHLFTISGTFLTYAFLNVFSILFVVFCIEDMTGVPLEEISDKLAVVH